MTKLQSRKKAGRRAFETNIMDGLTDAVILVDENRIFVDGNPAALDLVGHFVKGLNLAEVIDCTAVIEAVDSVLGGKQIEQGEIQLPHPVARTCEMRVTELPSRNPEKPDWVMLILRDVTDARKTEQMRADFVSNVSHELRSPVSSLLGFIETLQGPARDDPEARDRFLGIMEDEAKRMAHLVNDLLTLSKVEADEHNRPDETINMAQLLGEISTVLSRQAGESNMQIEVDLPEDLPEVIGSKDELIQVFRNLIDNAINYGNQGSSIRIRTENQGPAFGPSDTMMTFSVVNQGPGIAADDLVRLTERFYRVDKGRSRAKGGTGLGLAIVKHILKRHRGTLDISSNADGETVFSVSLPVRQALAAE